MLQLILSVKPTNMKQCYQKLRRLGRRCIDWVESLYTREAARTTVPVVLRKVTPEEREYYHAYHQKVCEEMAARRRRRWQFWRWRH